MGTAGNVVSGCTPSQSGPGPRGELDGELRLGAAAAMIGAGVAPTPGIHASPGEYWARAAVTDALGAPRTLDVRRARNTCVFFTPRRASRRLPPSTRVKEHEAISESPLCSARVPHRVIPAPPRVRGGRPGGVPRTAGSLVSVSPPETRAVPIGGPLAAAGSGECSIER